MLDLGSDLRVRVLGRDPADVGRLPRRARSREGGDEATVPLRHARRGRSDAPHLHGRSPVAAGRGHGHDHVTDEVQSDLRSFLPPGSVLDGTPAAYLADETETRGVNGRADAVVLPEPVGEVAKV